MRVLVVQLRFWATIVTQQPIQIGCKLLADFRERQRTSPTRHKDHFG